MVLNDQWFGFYLIFFNIMYIMNSIAYWNYYKDDCFETRRAIQKSYFYILIQGIFLYTALFIVVYNIPASTLPDNYEDSWGQKYEFPPDKKEDMKEFALYFIVVIGVATVWFQWYIYRVVSVWASKDKLIEHVKHQRELSYRATSRRA